MSTVNINNTDNQVTAVNANQSIIITDNRSTAHTSVTVTQPVTSVVLVNALGPQGPVGPTGGGDFVTTSSFNAFTGSYNTGSFTGSFTGSLFGTSSYITGSIFTSTNPALSASYALTASYALNGGNTSPSSPDRSIQFNSSNIFGGSADLTFDTGRQLNALRLNVTGRLVVQGWSKIDSSDSPYDVKTDESIIICDTSSGPIVLDINTTAVRGRILTIKDVGGAATNNITFGSAVIDGESFTIAADKQSITITYDIATGEWYIIGSYN
jgi:hypothetical protein